VKRCLWQRLLDTRLRREEGLCLVDSFAVAVCSFARAPTPQELLRDRFSELLTH
jgi:hypothetical protein